MLTLGRGLSKIFWHSRTDQALRWKESFFAAAAEQPADGMPPPDAPGGRNASDLLVRHREKDMPASTGLPPVSRKALLIGLVLAQCKAGQRD